MFRYGFLILFLCLSVLPAGYAQDEVREDNVLFGNAESFSYLKQWYMIGPIPVEDIVAELEQEEKFDPNDDSDNPNIYQAEGEPFLGWPKYKQAYLHDILSMETNPFIQPKIGVPTIIQNKSYEWRFVQTDNRSINLRDVYGDLSNVIIYAYTELPVEEDKKMYMSVGSDDSMSIWVNGEPVYTYLDDRPLDNEDDFFTVNLKKGVNQALVKVMNVHLDWGFSVRIYDTGDLPMRFQMDNMVNRFVDTSVNNSSVIWIPVVLGLFSLFLLIAVFLLIAKLFGGGEKLH